MRLEPPAVLFHGTVSKFLRGIRRDGLHKGGRHHVHLSPSEETARAVGGRREKSVLLKVLAGRMHKNGHTFLVTPNGVWLTEHVPSEFLEFS